MTNTPRWLWVTLISSVQLALLLIAVLSLFGWLGHVTSNTLGRQTCLDNQLLGQRVTELIVSESIRDIRSGDAQDHQRLEKIITNVDLTSDGFVWVIDHGSGNLIVSTPIEHSSISTRLSDLPLFSISNDKYLSTLGESVSNQVEQRFVCGSISWNGGEYFISAQFLPQLNAILIIGQQRSLASQGLAGTMQRTEKWAFGATLLIGLIGTCLTVALVRRIGETVTSLSDGLEKVVSHSARELVRTKNAVIFGLAKLAESRDNDTGEHLERIRVYVTILAKEIAKQHPEFDEDYIHNLGLASSLHDIGKVGIPDSILLKPGRLTPEERQIMEIHTLIGGECLDAIHDRLGENEFMHIARQVAYHHHERWDGTGYPHSLKSTEIPMVARIVAVADVYDALTSKRPYKSPMSHLESKEIIVSGSGKHFDPEVVEAFLRHEDEFQEISLHQLSLSDEDVTSGFQRLCESAPA